MSRQAERPIARVLGTEVDALNMPAALAAVDHLLRTRTKGYVCVAGVHGVMEAHRCPALAAVYAGAALTIPDGMPLVWVGRGQGHAAMDRVTGPDIMLEIFGRPEFRGLKHFLYGGAEGVACLLQQSLMRRFPDAQIVGTYTPPFRDLDSKEEQALITQIAHLQPDIIWIGLSCPRQELFMAHYLPVLQTRLMFGVGAAFDFHTGRIRDCSEWVKRAGLQWFHRLLQDPARLWRRYLRNNPAFLFYIARQFILQPKSMLHRPLKDSPAEAAHHADAKHSNADTRPWRRMTKERQIRDKQTVRIG